MVLETLWHHKLYAMASKYHFGRSSLIFHGQVISERGVAIDPHKVAAVAESPEWAHSQRRARTCASTWASLITIVSSCCTSQPLQPGPSDYPCSPRARFKWGDAKQRSFDALKDREGSAHVLPGAVRVGPCAPDAPAYLRFGARRFCHPRAARRRLRLGDEFHPVSCESRKLTPLERLY